MLSFCLVMSFWILLYHIICPFHVFPFCLNNVLLVLSAAAVNTFPFCSTGVVVRKIVF
jgi:hypothetical protein